MSKRRGSSDRNRTATAGFGGSSSFGASAPSASAAAGRLLRLGTADRYTPAKSPLPRRQFTGAARDLERTDGAAIGVRGG